MLENYRLAAQLVALRVVLSSTELVPFTSYLFVENILLSTLFSTPLSVCSSFNVREQVSYPYRTTGKFVVFIV
jgi:hypothetical protein